MGRRAKLTPLTEGERQFAQENYGLVWDFLNKKGLDPDEWHGVVVMRYLLSVKKWFSQPELHKWRFGTVAYQDMRGAVANEYKKQGRRLKTASLDETVPGTDGCTYMDMVTYGNLDLTYMQGGDEVEIRYDVETLPGRLDIKAKSEETLAVEAFLKTAVKGQNMCFEYGTKKEAASKMSTVKDYIRRKRLHYKLDAYRRGCVIYIIMQ